MSETRKTLLDWAEAGLIEAEDLPRALALGGVLPRAEGWRHFLDRLLLWLGTALAAAGVICFFAYNWNRLGRFFKLGLVEAVIVLALVVVWRVGVDGRAGKAALLTAALAVGALVALIGQTYQTGADTAEIFATWALLILPWVLVARFPALWLVWLALLHLVIAVFDHGWANDLKSTLGAQWQLWLVFFLDAGALAVWEILSRRRAGWLRESWALRLLALAGGVAITVLACLFVVDLAGWPALVGWVGWSVAIYLVYRRIWVDVFALAVGALSTLVVVSAGLFRIWGEHASGDEWGRLLLMGLIVTGLTAAAAWWLQRVAREDGT